MMVFFRADLDSSFWLLSPICFDKRRVREMSIALYLYHFDTICRSCWRGYSKEVSTTLRKWWEFLIRHFWYSSLRWNFLLVTRYFLLMIANYLLVTRYFLRYSLLFPYYSLLFTRCSLVFTRYSLLFTRWCRFDCI